MNASPAIAVTGVAVLSPLADSVPGLLAALHAETCRVERAPHLAHGGEAKIADFDAGRYANVRGMRVYNRPTQAAIGAAKLALDAAAFDSAGKAGERLGLVMATAFNYFDTVLDYDRSLLTNGLIRTNPAWMPIALMSAPGAATALAFNAKAFSVTLSDGGASSLDALALAARLLAAGRGDACLVVGAFSPCRELSLSAERAGWLAPAAQFRVFDEQSCGTALGEAAVALLLERHDAAQARGAIPLGFVRGHGTMFAGEPARIETALAGASRHALTMAGITSRELSLISSGANGHPERDRAEARALLGILGPAAERPLLAAIKANAGDSLEAAGLLQAAFALAALRDGKAPPLARLATPATPGLRYPRASEALAPGAALVTSTSHAGSCSAAVMALSP